MSVVATEPCHICDGPNGTETLQPLNGLPLFVVACDACRYQVTQRHLGVIVRNGDLQITGIDGRGQGHPRTPAITSFSGEYRFLSNFYIEPDGTHVEAEFQAAKCAEAWQRAWFTGKTPAQCKAIGRKVKLTPDWEDIKIDTMTFYVRKKFKDHPSLKTKLLATCYRPLVEGNTWGDRFWGVCQGRGMNWLGAILEEVRSELSV